MKNRFAYFAYYFRFHKKQCIFAVINLGFLLAMLLTDLPEAIEPVIHNKSDVKIAEVIAMIYCVIGFIWSLLDGFVLEMIRFMKTNTRITPSTKFISTLQPGEGEQEEISVNNHAFFSPKINRMLIQNENLPFIEDKAIPKTVSSIIHTYSNVLFQFLRQQIRESNAKQKMFFNEQKLCLTYDLYTDDDSNSNVTIHHGSYYDTFLTNICSTKALSTADTNTMIYNGWNLYPKTGNTLLPLELSGMNNEIGISTLAFTSDHRVVLWESNDKTQTDPLLLIPSGSGSADWKDRKFGNTFQEVISHSMTRELVEESSLKPYKKTACPDTRVIGYWRWLEKGGKPEFCGITKLQCRSGDVHANHKELSETREKKHYDINPLNAEGIKNVLDEIRKSDNISLPLHMNLLFLDDYINTKDLGDQVNLEEQEKRVNYLLGK